MNITLEAAQTSGQDPLERTGVLNLLWTDRDLYAVFGEPGRTDCLERTQKLPAA